MPLRDHKDVFMEKHDELRGKYAEEHGIEDSDIPQAVDDKLADQAMTAASDYFADIADALKDRMKDRGEWLPR